MKLINKKAFTLIELLAVILILGIIALIAIPTVNNIINESKKGAFKASVQNIVREIEQNCRIEQMKGEEITDGYTFSDSGSTPDIGVKGSLPTRGSIDVDDECNVSVYNVSDGNYIVSKPANSNNIILQDKDDEITLAEAIMLNNIIVTPVTTPGIDASLTTENSFLKSADNDGSTYYFRGNVDNNYVEFGTYKREIYVFTRQHDDVVGNEYYNTLAECQTAYDRYSYDPDGRKSVCTKYRSIGDPIMWRIIRINGDGTVRMIMQDSIGALAYNSTYNNEKYVGYTYDKNMTETDSTIKEYLEDWYDDTIGDFPNLDNLVATTKFCNDTSGKELIETTYYYAGNGRMSLKSPSFKCAQTNETYGGEYNLKIGLPTVDEFVFAGVTSYNPANPTNTSVYIYNGWFRWTMTPSVVTTAYAMPFVGSASFNRNVAFIDYSVSPVINIKADAALIKGTGRADTPYIIVEN